MYQIKNITKLVRTESSFKIESEFDNYKWSNELVSLDTVLRDCRKLLEAFKFIDDGTNYCDLSVDNDCFNLVIRRENTGNLYIWFKMADMSCRLLFETEKDFRTFLDD